MVEKEKVRQATVFVVEGDVVTSSMLARLAQSLGLAVKTFGSAEAFLDQFTPETPGCLVTDIHLSGMSGLELQQELLARGAALPTIVITAQAKVPMAVAAMRNQAVDFLEKPLDAGVLTDRIRQAVELDRSRRVQAVQYRQAVDRLARLSPRETEVMRCVVEGMSNKQIAAHLHLSEKTIEVHRGNVMRKSEADSVAELVKLALLTDR